MAGEGPNMAGEGPNMAGEGLHKPELWQVKDNRTMTDEGLNPTAVCDHPNYDG